MINNPPQGHIPSKSWIAMSWNSATNTVVYFSAFALSLDTSGTETLQDLVFDYAFIIKRFRISVAANGRAGNTVFSFRDDGVDALGVSITIGSSATGEFDSGPLDVYVEKDSKINWKCDPTGASSGTLRCTGFIEIEIL